MKIYSEAQEVIKRFTEEEINLADGLTFNTGRTLKMCNYYLNSRHLTGNKDNLQRERPFYNIVNFRVTVAKVATDLDIKDILINSDDPQHWVHAMLLQKESYEWMKRTNFSQRLNEQGLTRPRFGGVAVKKREDGDELHIDTVQWKNFYCDQVDFSGVKIEKHYMTPVEMMAKDGAWENVREGIKYALNKQKDAQEDKEHYTSDRIEVLEVHGTFPKSRLLEAQGKAFDEEDDWVYSKQVYFMLECSEDYIFYAAEEAEDPYMFLPWEVVDGRTLGRGVVEESEEAQVWTNDAVINQKNATDLASRVVIKTNSKNLGNNMLEIDNGKIFELKDGEDMNAVQMQPSALGFLNDQIVMWERQANNATSVYESNTGEQAPANTPYSQTALLNQVASKPFDYRREEHGIFLSQMWDKWVIPYLIKRIKKNHILTSDFGDEELAVIDEAFINSQAKNYTKALLVRGIAPTPVAIQQVKELEKQRLAMFGRKRYIEVPENFFDNVKAKVTVITTGEQRNKAAVLTSLSSLLQTVVSSYNPQTGQFGILQDPVLARIFGQIVEIAGAGISPISLMAKNSAPTTPANVSPLGEMAQQPTGAPIPRVPDLAAQPAAM